MEKDQTKDQTKKDEAYTQLCVWPGVVFDSKKTEEENITEFTQFMKEKFNARIKFKCIVETLPDIDAEGNSVPGTGGRSDLMFYVHVDDLAGFSISRLQAGIRWWEDVIKYNDGGHLYTEEFLEANPPTW